MKVKNIKSFIDFYRYMGISTCISSIPRSVKNEKQLKNSKKKTHSNNILVLPGTHDANKIYDEINNKNIDIKSNVIFYIKFHPKKVVYAKDSEKLKVIKTIKNKKFSDVLISSTSTLVYDFLNMKKKFMVYNFDNKQNLISSNLKKKIRFYNF